MYVTFSIYHFYDLLPRCTHLYDNTNYVLLSYFVDSLWTFQTLDNILTICLLCRELIKYIKHVEVVEIQIEFSVDWKCSKIV